MRPIRLDNRRRPWPRPVRLAVLIAVIAVSGAATVYFARQQPSADNAPAAAFTVQGAGGDGGGYRFQRLTNPGRTVVLGSRGTPVATFTDTARTVLLQGAARSFAEPKFTGATVNTTAWVRLAPHPWREGAERDDWFRPWLDKALQDTSPDVLQVAMEYLDGAPEQRNDKGVRYRGDASFGPVATSGAGRLEQSDFADYLGIPWAFPDVGRKQPKPDHYGAVDCSGFVRLVYGYRSGYPLLGGNTSGPGLPRRAYAIAKFGPGALIVPNQQRPVTQYDQLQPGDLVFFEVEGGDDQLDHSGIYLGVDSEGHRRFVSSRERANGPTFGDLGGTSLLDDGGFYARGFRAARRI